MILLVACSAPPAEITVLAASSLTDALPRVAEAWTGGAVSLSFDASSRLARQVEQGVPADVLITADRETLDAVAEHLAADTRRDLLGNTLVVVVPAGAPFVPGDLEALADGAVQHLALAGENVPAGKYARAALEDAGVWARVAPRIVRGDNVRTTLGWVARGEAEAGLVYLTDALAQPEVKVAFTVPERAHPPIVYPAAALARAPHPEAARAFLAFCASPEADAIFVEAGFRPL